MVVHWSEIHVDWLKRVSPADFAERELYLVSQAELHPSYHCAVLSPGFATERAGDYAHTWTGSAFGAAPAMSSWSASLGFGWKRHERTEP